MKGQQNIISIAEFLHSNYEFFAQKTGWQTQEKCQVDFWALPPANIKTMLYLAEHLEGVFNIDFETFMKNTMQRTHFRLKDLSEYPKISLCPPETFTWIYFQ